ncbi:hypothetical protein FQR65_LT19306 [Abscondita terminalis]|nr:hypothetical protein FQR65_LT19306 [Abscondita terminalis]
MKTLTTAKYSLPDILKEALLFREVAALMKDTVTHVAILAVKGRRKLYSLYKFAEDGQLLFNYKEHNMAVTGNNVFDYVKNTWNDILSDPNIPLKISGDSTYLRCQAVVIENRRAGEELKEAIDRLNAIVPKQPATPIMDWKIQEDDFPMEQRNPKCFLDTKKRMLAIHQNGGLTEYNQEDSLRVSVKLYNS